MAVTDGRRRKVHDALRAAHGDQVADDMMELLPPVGWGDVARQSDMVAIRGEIAELRGEMLDRFGVMEGRFGRLEGQIAELKGTVQRQIAGLVAAQVVVYIGLVITLLAR